MFETTLAKIMSNLKSHLIAPIFSSFRTIFTTQEKVIHLNGKSIVI